ncbi:MAG: DUF4445 domain-containing protein [Anaerofustis stercorihominis]|nr:DUF4445 domain-containing protein [Anaerofustis stercorihominis]
MAQITFKFEQGEDIVIFANDGENLLDVAKKANVAIDAPCSGNVSCGKCKVKLVSGEIDSPITRHISQEEYDQGYRLACNSKVTGDVAVLIPDISAAYRSRMKIADLNSPEEIAIFNDIKAQVVEAGLPFENSFSVVQLTMDEPTMDDTMPDNERLKWKVCEVLGVENVVITYYALTKLPLTLREANFDVKAVVRKDGEVYSVVDIFPAGEDVKAYGLAVDIGTTTVSMVLVDLATGDILAKGSSGNGQIRYGADVINRIIQQSQAGGVKTLQDAVIKETINPIVENMARSIKIDTKQIYSMLVASNTTMNHLFMGIHADYLRMEPYIPTFFETDCPTGIDLGLNINPHAEVDIAPNIGSYVGGDITAGTLASMIWNSPELSLFIDLGTNGEIVFGNADFLVSCACSAGPAFEGGDISCGMRATDGAIESITIDKDTMEPTYSVIGDEGQKPIGLCGSGIIDIISELFLCGIITPKGKFCREGKRIKHDEYGIGSYVIAFKEEADSVKDIELTEVDIDNFIRAKGAIFSAINVMLEMMDMDVSLLEKVFVAGGIGSGIDMQKAINIGMLPDIPLEMYKYIGNSSLSGAYCMIMSDEANAKVAELSKSMTYIELSSHPGYMDEFQAACFLPHTNSGLFPSVVMK